MNVIIFADTVAPDMAPLTGTTPFALLPVAGKPLIMHALESLHRSGFRDITIVSADARRLGLTTDTGPLLGTQVRFQYEGPTFENTDCHSLVIDLARLPDTHWPDLLARFGDLKVHATFPLRLISEGDTVGLLIPPRHQQALRSDWADCDDRSIVNVLTGAMNTLRSDSVRRYFDSNFAVLRGEFSTFRPSGRPFTDGLRMGPKAQVKPASIRTRHGYLGQNSRVDKTAQLVGEVIVGEQSLIGRNAVIENSIVLDNTYLGKNTHCRNSIVCRDLLLRVDTGTCVRLYDPLLFGATA